MWLTAAALGLAVIGQAEPAEASESAAAIAAFVLEAAEYEIRLSTSPAEALKIMPAPLLKWSNPARTSEDGAVFLWLKDGRPEVIGSMFTYKLKKVNKKHEFHSLATVPLSATFRGIQAWKAPTAGVKFATVPDAPLPAANGRLRLIQLKSLARDFSASIETQSSGINELRLLPQPLHRYEPSTAEVQDGAIFSFAVGTDPEALLLLESRKHKGAWRWEFAFARFHFAGVVAKHKDQEVFRVAIDKSQSGTKIGDPASRDKIYVTYHVD